MLKYRFGPFELDPETGELRRDGEKVQLQDLPFRLLAELAANGGRVVRRESLKRLLWPDQDFGEFEDGLNTAIRKLRQALQDDPRQPNCIETLRGYGYRLLLPVEVVSAAPPPAEAPVPSSEAVDVREPAAWSRRRHGARWAIAGILVFVSSAVLWWLTPLPPPAVSRLLPVTSSGRVGYCLRTVSDGARVFYINGAGDHFDLLETSVIGGASKPVPSPFPGLNIAVLDVSPDRSRLLVGSYSRRGMVMPLWIMPVVGGPPVRLGGLEGQAAAWSHDGHTIAFVQEKDLWIADVDGRNPRRIASMVDQLDWPTWSLDDRRLRFSVMDSVRNSSKIWEISVDGGSPRPLDMHWPLPTSERYGSWSADGAYYFFNALDAQGRSNLWALRERGEWWRRSPKGPFQLTAGPFNALGASAGPDGHVYFCSGEETFDMAELDPANGAISAFLPDLAPEMTVFSPDHRRIVYAQGGSRELWVANADGKSGARRLTPAEMDLRFPRWSPDGRSIAFTGHSRDGQPDVVYVVSADGGPLQPLAPDWVNVADPDWSPDGTSVVVSHADPGDPTRARHVMEILNLATHQATRVPDGDQVGMPRWSPDGRFIAAVADDGASMRIFDVAARTWRIAGDTHNASLGAWSSDGSYLYFQDRSAPGLPFYRVRANSGRGERVADCSAALTGGASGCALTGIAADGRLLIAIRRGASNLYAAELR